MKKNLMAIGVEAGIQVNYVPLCVEKLIWVDAKSENVPGSQNKVKGQLGAK